MKKTFILDTNVLLDSAASITELYDNGDNDVIIPYSCILELDRLKGNPSKSYLVSAAVDEIEKSNAVIYKRCCVKYSTESCNDTTILDDVESFLTEKQPENPIFITNDKIFRLRIQTELNIETQEYKNSKPFLSDTELYTGVMPDGEMPVRNSFFWREGHLYWEKGHKLIDYENEIWKITPRTVYQNMLMELLLDEEISVVSVQSAPGYGKTFLTLAAALQLVFQKEKKQEPPVDPNEPPKPKKRGRKKKSEKLAEEKSQHKYRKVYIIRPTTILGDELGFLPGDLEEKIDPYFRPIRDLLFKLHEIRPCNRIFIDGDPKKGIDKDYLEFLPITYLRGMNIEDAVVVIDECLAEDQLINMSDGSKKTISQLYEELLEGKRLYVKSFNTETKEIEDNVVLNIKKKKPTEKVYKITLSDGTILKLTENHKLYDENLNIKKVKDLSVGDKLIKKDGTSNI